MITIIMIIIDGLLVYYGGSTVLTALGFGLSAGIAGMVNPGFVVGILISIAIGIGMVIVGLKGIYKRTIGRNEKKEES